jgi:hypothetical protein
LVGGGGIAMELARHPVLQHCDVVWVRVAVRVRNRRSHRSPSDCQG